MKENKPYTMEEINARIEMGAGLTDFGSLTPYVSFSGIARRAFALRASDVFNYFVF
jgi:hypothetical protein